MSLAERCQRVVVSGLSMGGTLSCALAARHPDIAGIAVVNPMVDPPNEEYRGAIRSLLESRHRSCPRHRLGHRQGRFGRVRLRGGAAQVRPLLLRGGRRVVPASSAKSAAPSSCFSSRQDHVVEPCSGDVLARSVGGPIDRVFLERSYHVATLDWDAPIIEERVVTFCGKVMGGPGKAST